MDVFFRSNPGMASRIAHHIDFPDFSLDELMQIAELMLEREQYLLAPAARDGVPRVRGAAHAPAALRQRQEHPECHRPAPAAAGAPVVVAGGPMAG